MNRTLQQKTVCFLVAIVFGGLSAHGAEIRLKPRAICHGQIVVLGDIAHIIDEDPQQAAKLAEIWMFPTPDKLRTVRANEVQTVLQLHSIDLKRHNFTGARSVRIEIGDGDSGQPIQSDRHISKATLDRAKTIIETEIVEYLRPRLAEHAQIQVNAELATLDANPVVANQTKLVVTGGTRPWFGPQRFYVDVPTPSGNRRVSVSAVVTQAEVAAYVTETLRRGEVIQARHIELRPVPANSSIDDLVYRPEYAIGKEVTRTLNPDQPIAKKQLQAQLLVRRNEKVTVTAIAPGVKIRSFAYADEDGARDDLIRVRTLDRKKRFNARVVDFHRVEVYAGSPRVDNE